MLEAVVLCDRSFAVLARTHVNQMKNYVYNVYIETRPTVISSSFMSYMKDAPVNSL